MRVGTLFSVGYLEKDLQDIRKTPNTTSYFTYLLNQRPFHGAQISKEKVHA